MYHYYSFITMVFVLVLLTVQATFMATSQCVLCNQLACESMGVAFTWQLLCGAGDPYGVCMYQCPRCAKAVSICFNVDPHSTCLVVCSSWCNCDSSSEVSGEAYASSIWWRLRGIAGVHGLELKYLLRLTWFCFGSNSVAGPGSYISLMYQCAPFTIHHVWYHTVSLACSFPPRDLSFSRCMKLKLMISYDRSWLVRLITICRFVNLVVNGLDEMRYILLCMNIIGK